MFTLQESKDSDLRKLGQYIQDNVDSFQAGTKKDKLAYLGFEKHAVIGESQNLQIAEESLCNIYQIGSSLKLVMHAIAMQKGRYSKGNRNVL